MPRHDAIRLDRELAEAKLAVLRGDRFFGKIDGGERGIGHAFRRRGDGRADVCFGLVRWASAGERRGCDTERAGDDAGKNGAMGELVHECLLLVLTNEAVAMIGRSFVWR